MRIVVNITAWKRPYYLEKVILALKDSFNYDQFEYRVVVDGGFPERQKEIESMLAKNNFECELILHTSNLGCAGNVGYAFISSFDECNADAVIMLEDDTVPSKDYLMYMKDMLHRFHNDRSIFSISGYNRRVYKVNYKSSSDSMEGNGDPQNFFIRDGFTSWGWATWKHIRNEIGDDWFGIRWNHKNAKIEKDCPKGKRFLSYIIKDMSGSWAWPMERYWRKSRKEIAPDISRIQNIGAEEGTFAPGDEWHKNNHYCEIWMDGVSNIPIKNNNWFNDRAYFIRVLKIYFSKFIAFLRFYFSKVK